MGISVSAFGIKTDEISSSALKCGFGLRHVLGALDSDGEALLVEFVIMSSVVETETKRNVVYKPHGREQYRSDNGDINVDD